MPLVTSAVAFFSNLGVGKTVSSLLAKEGYEKLKKAASQESSYQSELYRLVQQLLDDYRDKNTILPGGKFYFWSSQWALEWAMSYRFYSEEMKLTLADIPTDLEYMIMPTQDGLDEFSIRVNTLLNSSEKLRKLYAEKNIYVETFRANAVSEKNQDEINKNLVKIREAISNKEVDSTKLYNAIVHSNMPYVTLGSLFKGREKFFSLINSTYSEGNRRIAIHGLGGIGKTRLAVEYAWENKDRYIGAFFVSADTPDILRTSLANLCSPAILDLKEYNEVNQETKVEAVLKWFQNNSNWLLIFDNLDTIAAAKYVETLFAQLTNGIILITSRLSEWSKNVAPLQLDVLLLQDATAFLLERTHARRQKNEDADERDAERLASELGQLSLALEQAGAYIEAKRITISEYRQRLANNQKSVIEWFDERIMGYSASVATTWQTSFSQLSKEAQTVLNRLAWLGHEILPRIILSSEIGDIEFIDMEEAVNELALYSLVTYTADGTSFSVHQLVQSVTQKRIAPELRQKYYNETAIWITNNFNKKPEDVRNWPLMESLQPHGKQLVSYAKEFNYPNPISILLNLIGRFHLAKGNPNEAERLYNEALKIEENQLGDNHPQVAHTLNNIALLLQDTNRISDAESHLLRALDICLANFDSEDLIISTRKHNLALCLTKLGRYEEAEELQLEAIRLETKWNGDNHYNIATQLNNLASIYKSTGRTEAAIPVFERAIRITEIHYGDNNPILAIRLNNLAVCLRALGRVEEAVVLYRRALKVNINNYDELHPKLATSYGNLAWVLCYQNSLIESEELYDKALFILKEYRKRTGHLYPATTQIIGNYMEFLMAKGLDRDLIFNTITKLGLGE